MNLLIKALEHAVRERTSNPPGHRTQLTLEETPARTGKPSLEAPPAAQRQLHIEEDKSGTSTHSAQTRSAEVQERSRVAESAPSGPRAGGRPQASQRHARAADAATPVMRLEAGAVRRAFTYLRLHPLVTVGVLAGTLGTAFGAYVYMQVTAPGTLAQHPAREAPHASPLANPVAATESRTPVSDAATATINTAAPDGAQVGSEHSVAAREPTTDVGAAAVHANTPTPSHNEAEVFSPATRTGPAALIPTSAVVSTSRHREAGGTSETRETVRQEKSSGAEPAASATPAAPPSGIVSSGSRESIAVSPGTAAARLNPHVVQGYGLLHAGQLEEAHSVYEHALEAEPINLDALLGLAYIAAFEHRTDDAMKTYLRVLQVSPGHGIAQAALIGLIGRADPIAAESRLKQLLSREPSAFLHFVLGNLYADQSSWSQAQHAYFQAHHLEPENADYAYNVAVGLDHLRQRKLALDFYRRAEHLATRGARFNFNPVHARERISSLAAQTPE